jgi:hypothetical protein
VEDEKGRKSSTREGEKNEDENETQVRSFPRAEEGKMKSSPENA